MSTVASLLSTVGLGAPSPAAYTDASEVASQQKASLASLQATVAGASLALTGAKAAGVSSTTLDNLQSLSIKGSTLMSQASNMTPAQLEAARSRYELEMTTAKFTAIQEQYVTTLAGINSFLGKLSTRITEVRAETGLSAPLLAKYEALLTSVRADKVLLLTSPPRANPPATAGSGSGSVPPPYAVPDVTAISDYQEQLDILDDEEAVEMNGKFSLQRTTRRMSKWMATYLYPPYYYGVIGLSALLGGIVMSNLFAASEQNFTLGRLFYFVYGALFFPVSVLWGCIKPPFWVAGIFPGNPRKPVVATVPTVVAAAGQVGGQYGEDYGEHVDEQGGGVSLSGLASSVRSVASKAKSAVSSAATKAKAAAAALTSRITTTTTPTSTPTEPINREIFVESGAKVLPPTAFDFFSFVLVDKNNPPEYQKKSQNTLWMLCIVDFIGILNLLPIMKILGVAAR